MVFMHCDADPLANLKVASPCSVRWEDMDGDGRVRFCGSCALHVYNFENMAREEVLALVTRTEGRVCGRFYRRADGTVITADCPKGFERLKRGVGLAAFGLASLASAALGAVLFAAGVKKDLDVKQLPAVKTVCNWATGRPPVAPMMGALAYVPPRATPTPLVTIRKKSP